MKIMAPKRPTQRCPIGPNRDPNRALDEASKQLVAYFLQTPVIMYLDLKE